MATLYRKYRPQTFSEVVGQNHIKITLEHEIKQDRLAHAYLFCGPRAVGKTTVARILAKAINCQTRKAGEHEPCDKCGSCKDIISGRSLDVMEIDAASHTGVDNVKENIISAVRVAPVSSKYKVFVIDEVHMLSTSAFNALLKVMEEPPTYVVFILCTTEVHKVPQTIISRCQRFDFRRISLIEVTKKLQYIASKEDVKIDTKILEAIARQSEGHMRDAESLLGQVVAIGGKEITANEADLVIPRSDLAEAVKLVDYLAKKDAASAVALINNLVNEGVNLKIFTSDLIEILRKILIIKINPTLAEKLGLELGENLEMEINKIRAVLTVNQIIAFMERLMTARNDLKGSFIIQLPLEIAVVELCVGASNNAKNITPSKPTMPSINPVNISTPKAPVLKNPVGTAPTATASEPEKKIVNKDMPAGFNKEMIMAKWHEVLAKTKSHNHSLSFILRACLPVNLQGNQLCLAFKYKFHKDRINDINIKRLVENILQEVYDLPLLIEAIVDETLELGGTSEKFNANSNNSYVDGSEESGSVDAAEKDARADEAGGEMINNLLKTFGGKIVS